MAKNKFFESVKNALFPKYYCPVCGKETKEGKLCKNCREFLIEPKFCKICGEHVGQRSALCLQCKEQKRNFDQNRSVFVYNDIVANSILSLKYNEKRYLAEDFAKLLYELYLKCDFDKIDVVCCVPSSPKRLKKRGYNHAEDIAKEFCFIAGLPFENLLVKTRETEHQTELSRDERTKNLIDAFECKSKSIKSKNVLLIDDVFTTGSTLDACSKALRKAKPNKIYCLTVAKTVLNKA